MQIAVNLHMIFNAYCLLNEIIRFVSESGESSSSDDENLSDNNNSAAALSKINGNQETSTANGRSTQNDSSANFPIPSTSTGITGNGKSTFSFFIDPYFLWM